MKTFSKLGLALMMTAALLLTGCATTTLVHFNVNVPNATVIVNGQQVDAGDAGVKLSNAIWNDPQIVVKAPGQQDYRGSLDKEVKIGNAIIGILLFWPSLLFCYGPSTTQNIYLNPAK